jgi:hypothetical protein
LKTKKFQEYNLSILTSFDDLHLMKSQWINLLEINNSQNIYIDPQFFIEQFETFSVNYTPHIIVFSKYDKVVGFIFGKEVKKKLKVNIGYLKFNTPQIKTLEIEKNGILTYGDEDVILTIQSYFNYLLKLKEYGLIEFNHFSENSIFWEILNEKKINGKQIKQNGAEYIAKIRNSETGEVLTYHNAKTLRRFKKYDKNLNEYFKNKVIIKVYDSLDNLDEFLINSERITKKSYHYKMGIGILNNKIWKNTLSIFTKIKYFKGFILYGDSKPIANNYGLVYKNYYYAFTMSYDSDYRKIMPGFFLLRRVFENLISSNLDYFHFGYGEAEYKKKYANISYNEATFRIFGNTLMANLVFFINWICNIFNTNFINILNHFGLLNKIKKLWRTKLTG